MESTDLLTKQEQSSIIRIRYITKYVSVSYSLWFGN